MRKTFTLLFIMATLPIFYSCSKDILKSYDDRIIGTWELSNINKFGIGSSNNISFSEGDVFSFSDNGALTYVSAGSTFNGNWDIRKQYTDDEANRSLHITAVDFNNQHVRSEFFNDMAFTGTNRFKAFIYSGTRTYVFHFSRR